tara:strand:+ start:92 stop:484 length:393 start_codon:yes stop_codon:yes gene_type:complete
MSQKSKSKRVLVNELTDLSQEAALIEKELPDYAKTKKDIAYAIKYDLIEDSEKKAEALYNISVLDEKIGLLRMELGVIQRRLEEIAKELPNAKGGKWSKKYKKSINCKKPKGFSQKQYCKYGRKTRRKKN